MSLSGTYVIQGDTVIAGLEAKKVYSINEVNTGAVVYKMALREEDRKVFFIAPGSEQQYVLYDFNGTTGDVVSVAGVINNNPRYVNLKIIAKNKAHIHGIDRQVYRVKLMDSNNDEDFYSGWWIEGIGSELGPFNTCGFGAVGNVRFLLSCEVNGETIYDGSDQLPDEYVPLLREGVKWVCLETKYGIYGDAGDDYAIPRFYTIEIKGDTVIDGTTYKKCYRYSDVDWSNEDVMICSNTKPLALLREERRALYAYNYDNFYLNVSQSLMGFPWYDWSGNGKQDIMLYKFDEDEYFKFEGCIPFLDQNSEVYYYNGYGTGCGVFVEGVGFDSDIYGDLLTPFYQGAFCDCVFRSEVGLHHIEDADGNIIYYGKAYTADNGDTNCDGFVDVEDVNAVINIILNKKTQSDYSGNADITEDGIIDVEDVNAIINIILKVNK